VVESSLRFVGMHSLSKLEAHILDPVDINANATLYKQRCLHNSAFCRSCNIAMYFSRVRIGSKKNFPEA
jgi:hypothetical protein